MSHTMRECILKCNIKEKNEPAENMIQYTAYRLQMSFTISDLYIEKGKPDDSTLEY